MSMTFLDESISAQVDVKDSRLKYSKPWYRKIYKFTLNRKDNKNDLEHIS